MNFDRLEGLIPLIGGVLLLLYYRGIIMMHPDQMSFENWKARWGRTVKICAPAMIVFGLLTLFGLFH